MPVSRSDAALFAETSYDMLGKKSKDKRVKKINKKIAKTGFEVDKQHSNRDVLTLYNPTTNEISISHRGTSPTRVKDLKADLAIATGEQGKNKEFKKRTKLTEQALEAHPTAKAHGNGHSYGGNSIYHTVLSSEKARTRFESVHTFNAGASPLSSSAEKKARADPETKKQVNKIVKHHRVDDDAVSASFLVNKPLGKVHTYKAKKEHTEGIKQTNVNKANNPLKADAGTALHAHGLMHFYNKDQYHNEE